LVFLSNIYGLFLLVCSICFRIMFFRKFFELYRAYKSKLCGLYLLIIKFLNESVSSRFTKEYKNLVERVSSYFFKYKNQYDSVIKYIEDFIRRF